jgi:O-antigen ligase
MVVLTFSRSAMVGLLAGVMFLAVLRYRRLLLLFALIAVVFLFLPFTQTYIERFLAGLAVFQDFNSADLATQMRIGEYRDALTLIQRYPLLGVGFAGTPDVDIYLGVSSAYFLLAQEMGLIGLGAFLLLVVSIFAWGVLALARC